jgi:hypothetical protein
LVVIDGSTGKPLVGQAAVSLLVDVDSMSRTRREPIQVNLKWNRGSRISRTHDKIQIASVELEHDAAAGLINRATVSWRRSRAY